MSYHKAEKPSETGKFDGQKILLLTEAATAYTLVRRTAFAESELTDDPSATEGFLRIVLANGGAHSVPVHRIASVSLLVPGMRDYDYAVSLAETREDA